MKREGSLEFDDIHEKSGSIPEEAPPVVADEEEELNLPPGRLHSTRVKEKLSGSCGNLNIVGSFHSSGSVNNKRSKSFTHPHEKGTQSPGGSRSRSPSLKERTTTTTAMMGDSSISSLEDFVDNDILYDRQGLIDDLSQSSSKNMAIRPPMTNLPSVNERLSEETLDDCHAFADVVVRSSNASRAASVGTDRELFLDPLDEIDEEGGDDASLEDPSETCDQQVILTNMEKIAISHPQTEETSASALARGSSSIMDGETPSNA